MLLGEYDHTLDDKNRLTLPAKLREQLGDEVVITRGLDGCLAVYSRPAFDVLAARMGTLDPLSRETRTMQRWFFTGAPPVELDKAGRMVIPARLLEEFEIGREVTVAGVLDHLEIWDRASWREQRTQAGGSAEDVAERLANRD
ncbi:MAG TPA: division/cell wall cluster transcriptional repressor MraZ [Gaiellaceae bacterium]|jgi:MraZ protein|nr:division/cell wall cluster transcriptional repressor MraZ [Gaiellaceae bacterium]